MDEFDGKCARQDPTNGMLPLTDLGLGTIVGDGMDEFTDVETCLARCAQTQGAIACEYAQKRPLGYGSGDYFSATVRCTAFTTKAEGGKETDRDLEEYCLNFEHFKA